MHHPRIAQCLSVHRAYATLRFQLDEELGTHHGIDFDDFALLHQLADGGDEAALFDSLAAALGSSRSAMLRRLRPLEKIGLLAFHGGVADRRVALRPAGRSLLSTAQDTVSGVCARPALMRELGQLGAVLI
jgi:DNA-binding MarR family transcriptional regulator